jgi:hypothetical protein
MANETKLEITRTDLEDVMAHWLDADQALAFVATRLGHRARTEEEADDLHDIAHARSEMSKAMCVFGSQHPNYQER